MLHDKKLYRCLFDDRRNQTLNLLLNQKLIKSKKLAYDTTLQINYIKVFRNYPIDISFYTDYCFAGDSSLFLKRIGKFFGMYKRRVCEHVHKKQ